jgi:hypothetical protein
MNELKKMVIFILTKVIPFIKLCFTTLHQVIEILLFSRFNPTVKKAKLNTADICYILGNGPSLKENLKNNLEFLSKNKLIAVNDMSGSEYFDLLKPGYYVFADPCYWDKNVYHEFAFSAKKVLESIREKTTWPMYLIVPYTAKKDVDFKNFFNTNPNITLLFYNLISFNGFEFLNRFIYRHSLGMPRPQNVLIPCMMIAINLNFREINLLGVDHSWTQFLFTNSKNEICMKDDHFYDNQEAASTPIRMVYGETYKMHQILKNFSYMFEGYHMIKKYADTRDVKIFNRTKNSFIDAFERRDSIE